MVVSMAMVAETEGKIITEVVDQAVSIPMMVAVCTLKVEEEVWTITMREATVKVEEEEEVGVSTQMVAVCTQ